MGDEGASTPDLVGTWRLISYAELDDAGATHPWGERVVGRITYEPSGRMAVQMARSDRPRLSTSDLAALRPEEYRDAFLSYFSYFGHYTVGEGAVVHHVESASIADWVGTDQVRYCEMAGRRLTLRTPPLSLIDGREGVLVAVWERME
jgi:hypothetical protein